MFLLYLDRLLRDTFSKHRLQSYQIACVLAETVSNLVKILIMKNKLCLV